MYMIMLTSGVHLSTPHVSRGTPTTDPFALILKGDIWCHFLLSVWLKNALMVILTKPAYREGMWPSKMLSPCVTLPIESPLLLNSQ